MSEEIEEIKKKVVRHPDAVDLYIKRLPKKTRDLFVEFANNEFVGDYGAALHILLREFFINGEKINAILMAIDDHENRICALESNKDTESESIKGIRKHLKKRTGEKKDEQN